MQTPHTAAMTENHFFSQHYKETTLNKITLFEDLLYFMSMNILIPYNNIKMEAWLLFF